MFCFHPFTSESKFKCQFNQDRLTISVPLPLGGKSSEDLRIPLTVTSPRISMPQLDVEFAPREIQIPTFTIPSEYDLTLPLMGMVEASAKVDSNYYKWETVVSAGNNTGESPSYLAKFKVMADSPIKLLSFTTEGNFIFILNNNYAFVVQQKRKKIVVDTNSYFIDLSVLKELQKLPTQQMKL